MIRYSVGEIEIELRYHFFPDSLANVSYEKWKKTSETHFTVLTGKASADSGRRVVLAKVVTLESKRRRHLGSAPEKHQYFSAMLFVAVKKQTLLENKLAQLFSLPLLFAVTVVDLF